METPVIENAASETEISAQTSTSSRSVLLDWLDPVQSFAATVVIAIFVITFLMQAFQIPSESMENTLLIGDYLLVDKFSLGPSGAWSKVLPYDRIKHGDVIVFKWPVHPEQHFVKRVIGVPGDRIRLVSGKVFVNGVPANES